jgi:hypothetical protein
LAGPAHQLLGLLEGQQVESHRDSQEGGFSLLRLGETVRELFFGDEPKVDSPLPDFEVLVFHVVAFEALWGA